MYAIKFEADVHNGMIVIPEEYRNLESQHLQITAIVANNAFPQKVETIDYSDEYIKENWREMVSVGLSGYDENYYKSEQYKLDRGSYLAEKYK